MSDALTFAAFFLGGFLLALGLAAVVVKMLVDFHRDDRDIIVAEREQWRVERRELANRIQHPHVMPVAARAEPRRPTAGEVARQRDWASVGRIVPGRRDSDAENPDLP